MTTLAKPIQQARLRLWLNRSLASLGWTLTGAAGLFVLAVAVQRCWRLVEEPGAMLGVLAAGLAAGALVAAVSWTALTRESMAAAAAQLDLAAGLKERLSSGLYCVASSDPFAQAVVADAQRVGQGIAVRRHLPIRLPRSAPYAGGSLLFAFLVLWLFPTLDWAGTAARKEDQHQHDELVQRTQAQVRPIVQQTLEKIREKNPSLKDLVEPDALAPAPLQTPLDIRQQALKKIEQISEKLKNKQSSSELAQVSEFKKMLRQLEANAKSNSQVGKLSEALAKGDFKSAQAAIAAIQKELSKTPKTDEEKQQAEELKNQLKQLAGKLDQLAQDDRKARDKLTSLGLNEEDLKKAMESLKKKDFESLANQLAAKGLSQEQIQQAMQEMKKRSSACSVASKLGANMAMAAGAKGDQAGDQAAAASAEGLTAAGAQLSEMESLEQEVAQLNAAMADLENAKAQLGGTCSACNGTGMVGGNPCSMCGGTGMKPGPGMGLNPGQGQGGVAPEQQTAFNTTVAKTPVKTTRGSIISQRFVDGEQYKGEVSQDFVNTSISAEREATDAIAREQIPRVYQSSVKTYFTRARRELPADKVQAAPAEAASPK